MGEVSAIVMQLLVAALHELPELLKDGKNVLDALASSGDSGMQKAVNAADGFARLAEHARNAVAEASGNPDKAPASTLPQPGSIVSEPFPTDNKPL